MTGPPRRRLGGVAAEQRLRSSCGVDATGSGRARHQRPDTECRGWTLLPLGRRYRPASPGRPSPGPLSTAFSMSVSSPSAAAAATVKSAKVTSDSLPAESSKTAETLCGPLASGVVTGTVQLPSSSTSASPIRTPSMKTVTVAPGSPVPTMSGVESVVVDPSAGAVITGASGASSSTTNSLSSASDSLPASSVWIADAVCGPSASGVVTGTVQLPSSSTHRVTDLGAVDAYGDGGDQAHRCPRCPGSARGWSTHRRGR